MIRHHPKFLTRWAKNYCDWCFDEGIGSKTAKTRLAFMFDADTINKLKPLIIREFEKRGAQRGPQDSA